MSVKKKKMIIVRVNLFLIGDQCAARIGEDRLPAACKRMHRSCDRICLTACGSTREATRRLFVSARPQMIRKRETVRETGERGERETGDQTGRQTELKGFTGQLPRSSQPGSHHRRLHFFKQCNVFLFISEFAAYLRPPPATKHAAVRVFHSLNTLYTSSKLRKPCCACWSEHQVCFAV